MTHSARDIDSIAILIQQLSDGVPGDGAWGLDRDDIEELARVMGHDDIMDCRYCHDVGARN